MLSSLSDEENQLKGFQYGADDYVTKPYSPKNSHQKGTSNLI